MLWKYGREHVAANWKWFTSMQIEILLRLSITERLYVRNWEQKKKPRQVSF